MLKWSFPADVVDEPYRFDLPKPIDLLIMDEMEREQEWKYEQSRRRFLSEESAPDDMSLQSSSQASFAIEDDMEDGPHRPHKHLPDETTGFIPKLTDIQQKLKDEAVNKPVPKSVAIDEDSVILPKFEDAKEKYLAPALEPYQSDLEKKKPFEFNEEENFERLDKIKKQFPKPEGPKELSMPMAPVRDNKDFKKIMEDRKKHADTAASDDVPAPSAADEIRNVASDITKAFGEDAPAEKAKPVEKEEPATAKPKESAAPAKKAAPKQMTLKTDHPKHREIASHKPQSNKPAEKKGETKVMSLDAADAGEKKPKPFQQPKAQPTKQSKEKELTFEDSKDSSSSSNIKAFAAHRRKLRPVRKHAGSSNPVKAIQKRDDLRTETDLLLSKHHTDHVSDPEEFTKPVKQAKQVKHAKKSSHSTKPYGVRSNTAPTLATEAIKGLEAKENLAKASVALRKTAKNVEGISTETKEFGGFLSVMLLQIKGARHLQTRLVEPSSKSLNSGDAFVLVTPKSVYVWIGRSASIMKKARAAEVSTIVVKQKDLGTNAKRSNFIDQDNESAATGVASFWKYLGGRGKVADVKDFPSDEEYEKGMHATNIVYRVDYTLDPPTLKRRDDLSGRVLSEKFMDPNHAYVLDFGTEVYLWLGRDCTRSARLKSMPLAQKVYNEKFKFKSKINPFDPKKIAKELVTREVERPSWALLGRMTARSETVLFRQKFTDWPDHNVDYTKDFVKKPVSGSFTPQLPGRKSPEGTEGESADLADRPASIFDLKSYDVSQMTEQLPEPSMVLEGFDVGRGSETVNEEGWRFLVDTIDIKTWHVKEYSYNPLPEEDCGHFHASEGYVVQWKYCVKRVGVRTLKGQMSRQEDVGRDKVAYFFWQGRDSTVNEKGAAALMTVEIDSDKGPQILVSQGKEPPCFSRLFGGKMVVHLGKREPQEDDDDEDDTCMFIIRNEDPAEAYLLQVKTSVNALRSRTSFVIVDLIELLIYVWHGAKSSKETTKIALNAGKHLMKWFNEKFPDDQLELQEFDEGEEPDVFWDALRGDRSHVTLLNDARKHDYTPRAFRFTSSMGLFEAKEIVNPTRSLKHITPYPILQSQLYSAQQPALILVDAHQEVYMWQGWWPKDEDSDGQASTTGSAQTRLSNDRRLAMETIKSYAQALKRDITKTYIVFAGLEPKAFKSLFPFWENRKDVAEINIKAGRKKGEVLKLTQELSRLSRDNFSLKELQQKPLPEGVDPTRLEMYLDPKEFQKAFGMSKKEFEKLAAWKKLNLKKKVKLY